MERWETILHTWYLSGFMSLLVHIQDNNYDLDLSKVVFTENKVIFAEKCVKRKGGGA